MNVLYKCTFVTLSRRQLKGTSETRLSLSLFLPTFSANVIRYVGHRRKRRGEEVPCESQGQKLLLPLLTCLLRPLAQEKGKERKRGESNREILLQGKERDSSFFPFPSCKLLCENWAWAEGGRVVPILSKTRRGAYPQFQERAICIRARPLCRLGQALVIHEQEEGEESNRGKMVFRVSATF